MLAACGTEPKTLKREKGVTRETSCPPYIPVDFHVISFSSTKPIPEKIAIEIDGVMKGNDCAEVAKSPPLVSYPRPTPNMLSIRVEHFSAYPALPADVSFRIIDLGDCKVPPVDFFKSGKLPLKFVQSYPSGKQCKERNEAYITVKDAF